MEIQSSLLPTAPETGSPSGPAGTGSQVLGKDEFLRLLVTQLSHQDPLNPLDGQEFAAQLAQFSSVEQLINIEQRLSDNTAAIDVLSQSTNAGIAAGLIGKSVEAEGNQIAWTGEGERTLAFDLDEAADQVTVTIRDAAGNVVRTLELGAREAGLNEVVWNGEGDAGATVATGTYTFEVQATRANGDAVEAVEMITGPVARVTFGPEGILLWIGGVAVSMANVASVKT
ncbi:flagellar hook capping protein [Rhodocaloribacter litoris]|uniref:flagellar hook assembly protein FlgD n=1 Tax=Rhodocaloribacter litoris TaxID=2558931 RepID=UPI001422083E|nr:FlgD immunoglobulin-like domain containing protein [Rhodocaloribacter litoris]QXD16047.1 flagellar hook capping protein [Rhodocaloribacter litoris]